MTTLQDLRQDLAHRATDAIHALRASLDPLREMDLNRMRDNAVDRVQGVNLNRMRDDAAKRVSNVDLAGLTEALNRLDLSSLRRVDPREMLAGRSRRAFNPTNLALGLALGLGIGLVAGLVSASSRRLREQELKAAARLDSNLKRGKEPVTG